MGKKISGESVATFLDSADAVYENTFRFLLQ